MYKTQFVLALLAAASASAFPLHPPSDPPTAGALMSPTPYVLRRAAHELISTPLTDGLQQPTSPPITPDQPASKKLAKPSTTKQDSGHTTGEKLTKRLWKRARDEETAGGNARSGNTGDVDSGNINNIAGQDSTITNMGGNNVPQAGDTISGDATGGAGRHRGPGGNAYTGDTGTADGGYVNNMAGVVNNMGPGNNAGDGGISRSGEATGGVSY